VQLRVAGNISLNNEFVAILFIGKAIGFGFRNAGDEYIYAGANESVGKIQHA
jgi:hypothetical protein